MDINSVTISGRLTRDCDLKTSKSGQEYVTFSMAVNGRRKSGEEWVDDPNFFDVTMWGGYAVAVADSLTKGTKATVHGRLDWRQWETDHGEKRSAVSIIADALDINAQRERLPKPAQTAAVYDEEVPF